jgi:hypothetical protein
MLGISQYCHTSELLKDLKLFDINSLIIFMKLSFIRNIKNNNFTFKICSFLLENINNVKPKSSSFIHDYKKICNVLNLDFNYLINNINEIIIRYKKEYFDSECVDINYNIKLLYNISCFTK